MNKLRYTKDWNLTTIPDVPFYSEAGRRARARNPGPTTLAILKPCGSCGTQLNATQRRKPCPQCGTRNDDRKVTR